MSGSNGHPVKPVNVAVVGLGYWGPNLVRNLHELDAAEVSVVCDARDRSSSRRSAGAIRRCS